MSECFTEQIQLTEFIGDSLPKINNNFLSLQAVACQLSATVGNVTNFGVTTISGGINLKETNPTGSQHILEQQPTPPWHVGLTKNPLLTETIANRNSLQIEKESQFQESIERVQKHNPVFLKPVTKTVSTPTVFSGNNGYRKGVMLFDGKIFHIPFTSTANAQVYNYKNNTVETVIGFTSVNDGFFGGVLLPNGRVFCVPHNSTAGKFFIHNETSSNRFTSTNTGGVYPGVNAYLGGVLLPNGNVFLCPRNRTTGSIYNPTTFTQTAVSFNPPFSIGNNSFYGGVLTRYGDVCLVPNNTTSVYRVDQTGLVLQTPATLPGGDAFRGGVRLSTGEIFFVPYNATSAAIYDPVTDTVLNTPGIFPGSGAYETGTLLPDGRVFLCPANRTKPGIYNPFTQDLDDVEVTVTPGDYHGSVLLPNGRIYLMPCNSTSGLIITIPHYKNFTLNALSGPQLNSL